MSTQKVDRILLSLLVASLAFNIILTMNGNSLARLFATERYDSEKLKGRDAPAIPVVTLAGEKTTIEFEGTKPTILYVFSPSCGWCVKNTANIHDLYQKLSTQYRFMAISLTDRKLGDYLRSYPIDFEVTIFQDHQVPELQSYGFGATPAMYLVGLDSRIDRAWGGALSGAAQKDAERFFRVSLPGLSAQ